MTPSEQTPATVGVSLALESVAKTSVAIFAYRDEQGRPLACPVTPYLDGNEIVIKSTLAFVRKTVHILRDGRVALLAGGVHMTGTASVEADLHGVKFRSHFLEQELTQYPPASEIVDLPFSGYLFWWFFGRVLMRFSPDEVVHRMGDDEATLIDLNERGFPSIEPIAVPDLDSESIQLPDLSRHESSRFVDNRPAAILLHCEPTLKDLRQLLLRGRIRNGRLHMTSRSGSLAPADTGGVWGELRRQIGYHRRAFAARKQIQTWNLSEEDP